MFAGVVLGTALLALLTTLWFALAFNSGVDSIRVNLEWYVGITAIVSLLIGGLLAGWLSGVRGAGAGFFNGLTVWGLILIVALAVGIPAIFNVFNLGRVSAITDGTGLTGSGVDTALWVSFWTILGGFLAWGSGA
jgi:peptidoglycan/LPS O-acetylase OafA/YrhL